MFTSCWLVSLRSLVVSFWLLDFGCLLVVDR